MNIRLATAAVAAAGAALLTVAPAATAAAPAGPAAAVPQAQAPLKADLNVAVKGAELKIGDKVHTLDLTGKASLTIEAPTPTKLKTKVTGTLEVTGEDSELGKVSLKSEATGTAGFNSALQPFPATLELTATADLSVEKLATEGRMFAAPEELTAKDPVQLGGTLNQLPPKGQILDLKNPVDLVDSTGKVVGQGTKFPVSAV
ncbi:hypothetical protein [Streptomyces sp. Da 82-17]|uniref:hypothetical protein n=1 Tax=Streptomyces sp. Da 82-17 TaxID=3377116 RepID=UPI0038D35A40